MNEPKKNAPKDTMNEMDALLPNWGMKTSERTNRSGDATLIPMLILGTPYSPSGRCLLPAKTDRHRPNLAYLLWLASRHVPIWAFAFRAYLRFLVYVIRNPLVSAALALESFELNFHYKYGKERCEQKWVKAHLMTGAKAHVVTSVEITGSNKPDGSQLPELVNQTAKTFAIKEVSADKAYSTKKNLEVINRIGAMPYVPFKEYGRPELAIADHSDGSLWNRMWLFYNFNREQFLVHYHKRSNVESTFNMIKTKFGTAIRAKSPVAQVNEVLCKILCHNICVLIQSIYELGLEPVFYKNGKEGAL
jgi:transposase